MKPTIGRIVHFQPYDVPHPPLAAIVTDFGPEGSLGLHVVHPKGTFHVYVTNMGGPEGTVPTPGCWNWPPIEQPSGPVTGEAEPVTEVLPSTAQTKQLRKELDAVLQNLRRDSDPNYTGIREPGHPIRASRERTLAVTKIQEAIMWLGMDLKDIGAQNPYPHSYDPSSPVIEPTADGLKM
jgi:hypothetical protein